MPLRDHFHPPLSVERPWEGIHSAWASTLAARLNNDLLPPDYFAMPQVTVGGREEVDVGTFEQREGASNGAVATAVWAPPKPPLAAVVDFVRLDVYEVRVMQQIGGPQLRAAIGLVSPANKDRPGHRLAFAVKCAAYLQQGISVVVLDVVTERVANLHAELVELLRLPDEVRWKSATDLYAVAYRATRADGQDRIEVWPEVLAVGRELPAPPLWLADDLCLPLPLEASYETTCASLRIRP